MKWLYKLSMLSAAVIGLHVFKSVESVGQSAFLVFIELISVNASLITALQGVVEFD
jgi:hypothetical protein